MLGCMFVWKRRDDAASLSLADADDTVQRQQPADRLRGRNADCD